MKLGADQTGDTGRSKEPGAGAGPHAYATGSGCGEASGDQIVVGALSLIQVGLRRHKDHQSGRIVNNRDQALRNSSWRDIDRRWSRNDIY